MQELQEQRLLIEELQRRLIERDQPQEQAQRQPLLEQQLNAEPPLLLEQTLAQEADEQPLAQQQQGPVST